MEMLTSIQRLFIYPAGNVIFPVIFAGHQTRQDINRCTCRRKILCDKIMQTNTPVTGALSVNQKDREPTQHSKRPSITIHFGCANYYICYSSTIAKTDNLKKDILD